MARQQPIELFMPPNMLKAKVGGTFAGIDMAAIKRAEAAMEALKSEFRRMGPGRCPPPGRGARGLCQEARSRGAGRLLRAAHDMKGQAATFDFPLIARVAGSLSHSDPRSAGRKSCR